MTNPKTEIRISAVIPAYNAGKYIARAIDSILAQTCPVDEIIVVDDGSQDKTADIVRSYGDKVKLIQQPNTGVSAARNTGIEAAGGDWTAFLDADDEWMPERVQLQVELIEKNPELMWISGNYIRCLCDENRRKAHHSETFVKKNLNGKDFFNNYFEAVLKSFSGHTDTMLIHKKIFEEAGLFQVNQNQMEDMDLWWRIAMKYPAIGYVSKPIAVHHLGIQGSLIQSRRDFSPCRDMIRRHLTASAGTPLAESVKFCSGMMLRLWMRSMLFTQEKVEIERILTEFDGLFSSGYKRWMRVLISRPQLTACCLRWISWIVRFLKIRQQLTRKPQRRDG